MPLDNEKTKLRSSRKAEELTPVRKTASGEAILRELCLELRIKDLEPYRLGRNGGNGMSVVSSDDDVITIYPPSVPTIRILPTP